MKKETYIKLKKQFEDKYKEVNKNELGFAKLADIKVRDFKKFLSIYYIDNKDIYFSNVVSSIAGKTQYIIKTSNGLLPLVNIKINSFKSMFDKYPEQYEKVITFINTTHNLKI